MKIIPNNIDDKSINDLIESKAPEFFEEITDLLIEYQFKDEHIGLFSTPNNWVMDLNNDHISKEQLYELYIKLVNL